ncbi:MAG: hypothetical protein K0R53_749 [Burkholderiales bacterium]|nr:hypothetical protein [Burkholderiales bacterium]
MFDKERFIEDCRAALKDVNAQAAIRELVARAVSEPAHVVRALGKPQRSGVETIYRAQDLTILNLCWGPRMVFKPHDHRMWAVIGMYGGREENTFFRRNGNGLVRHGVKELNVGDAAQRVESEDLRRAALQRGGYDAGVRSGEPATAERRGAAIARRPGRAQTPRCAVSHHHARRPRSKD